MLVDISLRGTSQKEREKEGGSLPGPTHLRFNSHPPFYAGHAGYVNNDDLEYHRILLFIETQKNPLNLEKPGGLLQP